MYRKGQRPQQPMALPFNAQYRMGIDMQAVRDQVMPPFDGRPLPPAPTLAAVDPTDLGDITEFVLPPAAYALHGSIHTIPDGNAILTPSPNSGSQQAEQDEPSNATSEDETGSDPESDITVGPQPDISIFDDEDNAEALYVPNSPRRPPPALLRSRSPHGVDGDWHDMPALPSYSRLPASSGNTNSSERAVPLPGYEESSYDTLLMTSTRRVPAPARRHGSSSWASAYLGAGSSTASRSRARSSAINARPRSRNTLKMIMGIAVFCVILACAIAAVLLQKKHQNSEAQSHGGRHDGEHGP